MNLRQWSGIGTHRNIQRDGDNASLQENIQENIQNDIQHIIQEFEYSYSRFLSTSLVSQLNSQREVHNVPWEFIEMITLGIQYATLTEWYFSLMIGSVLEKLWYDASYSFTPDESHEDAFSHDQSSMNSISLGSNSVFLAGNQNIDLWGIGKWYLIDKIRRYFDDQHISAYSINGWGDIYHQDLEGIFWNVGLQHPANKDHLIWQVSLRSWALAASGAYYRTRGDKLHHLIDPYTTLPADTQLASVHTYHADATVADIASTALFVAPLDKTEEFSKRMGVEYMLVFTDLSAIRSPWFPLL